MFSKNALVKLAEVRQRIIENSAVVAVDSKINLRNCLICIFSREKSNLHYARGITPKRVTSGGSISTA